jgi:hypothetical protein
VGIPAVVAGLPWAVRNRLPERLATHWGGGSDVADGSMPFWAAAALPGVVWAGAVLVALVVRWRGGAGARSGAVAGLLAGGVFLAGAQWAVVRANLDHADWRQAGSPGTGVVVACVAAVLAGAAGWLAVRAREQRRL